MSVAKFVGFLIPGALLCAMLPKFGVAFGSMPFWGAVIAFAVLSETVNLLVVEPKLAAAAGTPKVKTIYVNFTSLQAGLAALTVAVVAMVR